MKRFPLPKSCRLTKPWEYNYVYRHGKRIRGRNFSLIFTSGRDSDHRLGISIHGIKKAVDRNRIKRIIREFFRLNRARLSGDQHGGFFGARHAIKGKGANNYNLDGKNTSGARHHGMDMVFAVRRGFAIDSPRELEITVRRLFRTR